MTLKEKIFIYEQGATLLETLLVLSIVMVLITFSVMYWQSVQHAKLTEQGYELLQDIAEAAQGWQPQHIDEGKYSGISANALLQEGSIPEQYITNFDSRTIHPDLPKVGGSIDITINTGLTTPWGGRSQVLVSQADEEDKQGMLKIVFLTIPNYACSQLANRINSGSSAEHDNVVTAGEEVIFDSAVCKMSQNKIVNKIRGSILTVWYHPDF